MIISGHQWCSQSINGYLIQVKAFIVELIDETVITPSMVGMVFGFAAVQQSVGSIADQMGDQFQVILEVFDNELAAIQHIVESFGQTIGQKINIKFLTQKLGLTYVRLCCSVLANLIRFLRISIGTSPLSTAFITLGLSSSPIIWCSEFLSPEVMESVDSPRCLD